jgi:hypothetical protein
VVDIHTIDSDESTNIDVALVKGHLAIEQNAVHETLQPPHTVIIVDKTTFGGADVEAVHGSPMVAPVPGKDARLHSLVRLEEAKHVVDGLIRESADPVEASLREGYLVPAP